MSAEPISNARADRAGELPRQARLDPGRNITEAELAAARETVERFRLRFLGPHLAVADPLQQIVAHYGLDIVVTARLKRYDRIVDKLVRHQRMRLREIPSAGVRTSSDRGRV